MQRYPGTDEPSVDDHDHRYQPTHGYGRWATRAPVLIAAGAAVGVVARYTVGEWSKQYVPGPYPAGTFVVNLLGCLLIGIVQYLFLNARVLGRPAHLLLVIGFCGGFTTFSTFSVETLRLIEGGHVMMALAYQLGSLVGGLLAVACGIGIAALGVRMFTRSQSTP
jgi:CrcB protein